MASKITGGGVAAKGQRAGGHLVEHDAEGEQVGAGVEFLAARLLGRHVGDGAQWRAGAGEVLVVDGSEAERDRLRAGGDARGDLGEAEVENLGVAARGDEDVGGLDVAVDDALGVGGVEGVGDFDGQREQGFVIERPPGDADASASRRRGTPWR